FDLGSAPLMRFTLIRLGAQHHLLVLTHHHLLMDGWSLPVLVRELLTLYEHKGDGAALGRGPPYRDYLAWLAGAGSARAPAPGGGSRLWREWKKPRVWRRRIAGVRRLRPSRSRLR